MSEGHSEGSSRLAIWLVLVALVVGVVAWRNATERRAEAQKAEQLRLSVEMERQRKVADNVDYLAEQAERQRCQEYWRALAAAAVAPDVEEAAMLDVVGMTACSNPQSPIRQRLAGR